MKFNNAPFQFNSVFWGLLAGVAIATFLIFVMSNNLFATVFGTLVALLVARPTQLRDFAVLEALSA